MSTNIIFLLNNGEVIGHSTDTVYGLVAKINKDIIEKINILKERDKDTPLQVLFHSLEDAMKISKLSDVSKYYLDNHFKKGVSYIVEASDSFNEKYLTKSFNKTVMFRIPEGEILKIIKEIGPLFATSANKHGEKVFNNKDDVRDVFNVEAFGGREMSGKASKIISLLNNEIKEIRK